MIESSWHRFLEFSFKPWLRFHSLTIQFINRHLKLKWRTAVAAKRCIKGGGLDSRDTSSMFISAEFLGCGIIIIYIWTNVLIFIMVVVMTMFRQLCLPVFFRCLLLNFELNPSSMVIDCCTCSTFDAKGYLVLVNFLFFFQ